ncbi:hypothetical protein [Roseococcus sp. YIM B11640]|uniref:hypothetical protein n=1 Tax=Roseococcus sp. YIM B11640 TaxID=3133973 RepID=UPI003C7B0A38
MSYSSNTVAKIQIEPEDLRKILGDQFRSEVTDNVWTRVRSTLTLGGVLSVGLLAAAVTGAFTWLERNSRTFVETEITRRAPGVERAMEERLKPIAQMEAQRAIQQDLASVTVVRNRISEQLPPTLLEALNTEAIRNIIREEAIRQTQKQLLDRDWRRGIERSVAEQQAGDQSLSALARFISFTDLLRDMPGQVVALRLLSESAARLHARNVGITDQDQEAYFLGQAITSYVPVLATRVGADDFGAHEPLLRTVAELLPDQARPDNAFEILIRSFSSPAAITFLSRRARESTSIKRDIALQALLSHPAAEAREREDYLFCNVDGQLREDFLRAVSTRSGILTGDASGQRFVYLVRCAEDLINARRLPTVDLSCLPSRDLSLPWRVSRAIPAPPRSRIGPQPETDVQRAVQQAARRPGCAPVVQAFEAARLRSSRGWSSLFNPAAATVPTPLMLGFAGLLPSNEDGTAPSWLTDLATGRGVMDSLVAAPDRNPAHIALLIERLSAMPGDMDGVSEAKRRIVIALAQMPAAPDRLIERLLLEAMVTGGTSLCQNALSTFARLPDDRVTAMPFVGLAESIACSRGTQELSAEYNADVLNIIRSISTGLVRNSGEARRALSLIALALGRETSEARSPAALLDWIMMRPADTDSASIAAAVSALLELEGPALVTATIERSRAPEALRRAQRQITTHPVGLASIATVAPYLEPSFIETIPENAETPRAVGGRYWRTIRLTSPAILSLPTDPMLVLIRSEPLTVLPNSSTDDTHETELLRSGLYLVGARSAQAAVEVQQIRQPPLFAGYAGLATVPPIAIDTDLRSQILQNGSRFYPFELTAGRFYQFTTARLEESLDTVIELLDRDGLPIPGARNDDYGPGYASQLCLLAPESGIHWLRVENFDGRAPRALSFELRVRAVSSCGSSRQ